MLVNVILFHQDLCGYASHDILQGGWLMGKGVRAWL